MTVRRITDELEIKSALKLALDVFMRFEATICPNRLPTTSDIFQ